MPNCSLRPFRDISPNFIINLFAFSGTYPTPKGTAVKVQRGWASEDQTQMLGDVGASYGNVQSPRWGVFAQVSVANSGETPIGLLLYDCKEFDENGEKMIFHPKKFDVLQVAPSGLSCPIVTKGLVLYSGVTGAVAAGDKAYLDDNGLLNVISKGANTTVQGVFLGAKDSGGFALLKLDM
jgi:hypothetical protein